MKMAKYGFCERVHQTAQLISGYSGKATLVALAVIVMCRLILLAFPGFSGVGYAGALATLFLVGHFVLLYLPAQTAEGVSSAVLKRKGKKLDLLKGKWSVVKMSAKFSRKGARSFTRHSHNHGRAHRRAASRVVFAHASGGGGGGSESDPGDSPGPKFPFLATLFTVTFSPNLTDFLFPWRDGDAPGCWFMSCL
jgi:hypothetical protein